MRLQKRKGSVTAAELPTIATAAPRQRSTCASSGGEKQPVYLQTPMAALSGRFDALKHRAMQGAWIWCSGDARLAVPVARAASPLGQTRLWVPAEDRRNVGRESWDFPASWQEAFQSIPALLHMPERVGHVFFFFFYFPLSILKTNTSKGVEELAFVHSVSRKRKALETAQPGAQQGSRGHRFCSSFGTPPKEKGGIRRVPLPCSASVARACIFPCVKSSVTLQGARSVC